jgi:hypothetical protein
MIPNRRDDQDANDAKSGTGKVWTKPSVTELRAGSAEAIPGSTIADGPLETIGS